MVQIISKDGKPVCATTIPYPDHVIKQMKRAGYKVKNVEDSEYLKGETNGKNIRKATRRNSGGSVDG